MAMLMRYGDWNWREQQRREARLRSESMEGRQLMTCAALTPPNDEGHASCSSKPIIQRMYGGSKRRVSSSEEDSEVDLDTLSGSGVEASKSPENAPNSRVRGFVDLYFPANDDDDLSYEEETTSSETTDSYYSTSTRSEEQEAAKKTKSAEEVNVTAQHKQGQVVTRSKLRKGEKIAKLSKVFARNLASEFSEVTSSLPKVSVVAAGEKARVDSRTERVVTDRRSTAIKRSAATSTPRKIMPISHTSKVSRFRNPDLTFLGTRRFWQCCVCRLHEVNMYNAKAHTARRLHCKNKTCSHTCCCNCSIDAVGELPDGQRLYDADVDDWAKEDAAELENEHYGNHTRWLTNVGANHKERHIGKSF